MNNTNPIGIYPLVMNSRFFCSFAIGNIPDVKALHKIAHIFFFKIQCISYITSMRTDAPNTRKKTNNSGKNFIIYSKCMNNIYIVLFYI